MAWPGQASFHPIVSPVGSEWHLWPGPEHPVPSPALLLGIQAASAPPGPLLFSGCSVCSVAYGAGLGGCGRVTHCPLLPRLGPFLESESLRTQLWKLVAKAELVQEVSPQVLGHVFRFFPSLPMAHRSPGLKDPSSTPSPQPPGCRGLPDSACLCHLPQDLSPK